MRNRKALDLKFVSAVHNGMLSLFSLAVFVGQAYETMLAINVRIYAQPMPWCHCPFVQQAWLT